MTLPNHLRAMFLDEFEELCHALEQGLLALEGSDDFDGTVSELFRSAHSLKGAAQVAGIRPLAAVADGMETLLSGLRGGILEATPTLVESLLAATDWLSGAAAGMRGGDEPGRPQARAMVERLAALAPVDEDAVAVADPALPPPLARTDSPANSMTQADSASAEMREGAAVRVTTSKLDQVLADATEVLAVRETLGSLRRSIAEITDSVTKHDRYLTQLRNALRPLANDGHLPANAADALDRVDETWRETASAIRPLTAQAAITERELLQTAAPLAESVLKLRMIPLWQVCDGLERIARDAAHAAGKQVALTISDGEVELDRSVALALRESLVHLVHNSVDHGIERPEERTAAGKPAVGHVKIVAELRGGRVAISVNDDGRGIRSEAVRAAAERAGLALEREGDLVAAVFAPGLSTAAVVTETSGRGVGLDAVRARIEGLGGSVDLAFQPNAGTTVTMVAPLTLSIVHAVIARVGEQILALPSAGVQRVMRVDPQDVRTIGDWPMVSHDGVHVPVMDLGHVLGLPSPTPSSDLPLPVLLVESAASWVALAVTELLGEQEVTVHDLGERLANAPAVLGAALLHNRDAAVVVSAAACARLGVAGAPSPTLRRTAESPETLVRPRVLLAEDTMTTRALEKGILEAAGYDVTTAVDGADAWERLRAHGADLVVSDVNMPRMDGFELCAAIRESRRFADLPVVLVTSLADESDRRRGMEVGASAYITKSEFDQGLLVDTVDRLLR